VIDLHCHILPGIDDGAADLADSVALARQAQADGVGAICATPHIRHDHDVRIAELPARVREVNAALERAGVDVRVLPGGEVAETALHGLTDAELGALALGGGGRWILLEPAPGPLSGSLLEAAAHLRARGFGAVIAHPERHPAPDLAERLVALAREGALVQLTAATLTHPATAETVLEWAARGLVHLLGSDAHSSRAGRTVTLSPAVAALRHVPCLAAHVDWIALDAPRAVVTGHPVAPPFSPS
jgi:protein-tyrosine phosphatase